MTEYVEQHLAAAKWNLTARLEDEVWWWTRGSVNGQTPTPPSLLDLPLLHHPRLRLVRPSHFDSAWAQLARQR